MKDNKIIADKDDDMGLTSADLTWLRSVSREGCIPSKLSSLGTRLVALKLVYFK